MIITKKKHQAILEAERALYGTTINELQQQLREARDLKFVMEKLTDKMMFTQGTLGIGGSLSVTEINGIRIGDNIAQYVPDHFGGQVIKQEATKVIEISKAGDIKTGLTRQKPDEGYGYILRRE